MFNFLKPIFGAKSYLGIDIGTTSIKIAEISRTSTRPKLHTYGFLESYGHLERLNDAIQTAGLKIVEKSTAELLKMLLGRLKTGSKEVIASIPVFSAFITLLEIPEMSEFDTAKVMPFQIKQLIPLPIQEVAIEWLKVGKKEDETGFTKQQILVISIPKELISSYQAVFELAGLKLIALEVESLGLARALLGNDSAPTLLVDIGGRSTNIAVVDEGFVKYNTYTDFAGGSLTQAISSGLNINIRRAEELKRQTGLLGTLSGASTGSELSTLILPFLDALINEIERARVAYEKNSGSKIERLVLAGGGANLSGIGNYFKSRINLPVVVGNPFMTLNYAPDIEPLVRDLGPTFAVAVGLGIKEFI